MALLMDTSPAVPGAAAGESRSAGRAALRSVLAQLTSRPEESLQFERTPHGKPYMAGVNIAFSISYSQGHTLLALSLAGAIGCDIEDRFRSEDAGDLSHLILHAMEIQALDRLAASEREDALKRYWVRKEAVLKAEGSGFLRDPRRVIVGLDEPQAGWGGEEGSAALHLHDHVLRDGCLAAVAGMDSQCSWFKLEP